MSNHQNGSSAFTGAVDTRWFKGLLADRGINQRVVADALGLDPASVSLMLRGRRRVQLGEAAQLAELLGVPMDDVLAHAGVDPEAGAVRAVPIVGWIDDRGEVHPQRPGGPRKAAAPLGMPDGAVALRFQTRDQSDGWLAFYVPTGNVDQDAVGRYSIVRSGVAWYAASVKRGYRRGRWTLTPMRDGDKVLEDIEVMSAAPVLWIKTA